MKRLSLTGTYRPLECVTGPGDVIYVPAGFAHAVVNLEPSAALAWQLPEQQKDGGHRLDEVAFRLSTLGRHGRGDEAEKLITDLLPWLRDGSSADGSARGLEGLSDKAVVGGLLGYVSVGELRRQSDGGDCLTALATAQRLKRMLGVGRNVLGPAAMHWGSFIHVARCFHATDDLRAAVDAALEGIDATPAGKPVDAEVYEVAAEAYEAQGLSKKAKKMKKRAAAARGRND